MVFKVRISNISILLALYIILSASFMRYVLNFITKNIGESGVSAVLYGIFAVIILLIIVYLYQLRLRLINMIYFVIILGIGMFYVSQMEIMVERWHIIMFGLLGWFISRDSSGIKNVFYRFIFSILFVLLIASLDEVFQLYLPDRVADVRDIVTGAVGSAWGSLAYLISAKKHAE